VCSRKRRKGICDRVRVRRGEGDGRARGARLELFVSEAASNLSKNMFDPFFLRGVNRPSTVCGGGTAQTVNRIFIILQR